MPSIPICEPQTRLGGQAAEVIRVSGADAETFGHRVLETKPLLSATHRAGTGT